jgi:hypothetical protein
LVGGAVGERRERLTYEIAVGCDNAGRVSQVDRLVEQLSDLEWA